MGVTLSYKVSKKTFFCLMKKNQLDIQKNLMDFCLQVSPLVQKVAKKKRKDSTKGILPQI